MSDAARAERLRRIDTRTLSPARDEILACSIVRNEVRRVGPLLDHHRQLGVTRFLVVDNGSTDGTVDALLDADDVHLWQTDADFRDTGFGSQVFASILAEHGVGHWTVIVDADECLVYPDSEDRPIADLCAQLDRDDAHAYSAVLLDLYADLPLADTVLPDDTSPLARAHWFDRRWRHVEVSASGPYENQVGVFGGVRRRLFGGSPWDYCLSKVPLLRFTRDTHLVGGQHWTAQPLAHERGAVLHFKLTAGLGADAWTEVARGQRSPDDEYHRYADALALAPDLSAFSPSESIRYEGTTQLVGLGIMGPVSDPSRSTALAEGLTAHALSRSRAGDRDRAVALLERAAAVAPTGVNALVRLAEVRRAAGDAPAAAAALAEACARRPEDLDLLTRTMTGPPLPPDFDLVVVPTPPGGATLVPSVDAAFGPGVGSAPPPARSEPWIGFVHGVVDAPEHLAPFREFSLPALVARPEFLTALAECRALITFTRRAGAFLRERLSGDGMRVPIAVVEPPVAEQPDAFSLERFADAPTVVQPGWWSTRRATVCDLTTLGTMRKVRCVDAPFGVLATALARAQRRHDGWATDPAPLRATHDLGMLDPATMRALLTDVVVLADLFDANADPIVLQCLARGLPVVVPALPGVIDLLGPGYPLHFSRPDEIAVLLADPDRIGAAHEHLLERRRALAPARFAGAVAAVWDGGP